MVSLCIKNLHVQVGGKDILKGVDLEARSGEIHVLMGGNGSGKTTLAQALMGKPEVKVIKGKARLQGEDLLKMSPEERFRAGLFLTFQHPPDIPGVSVFSLVRAAQATLTLPSPLQGEGKNKKDGARGQISVPELYEKANALAKELGLSHETSHEAPHEMIGRPLQGFSGGERKRLELLQMAMSAPKIAILDEIDSGLDTDGLQAVARALKELQQEDNLGILFITHTSRMLKFIKPDKVHVFVDGKIVQSGGASLAEKVEKEGYQYFK